MRIEVPDSTRTWAEIDLGAIRQNLGIARARIGKDSKIIAVVKANAYGHGMEEVARAIAGDVEMFGVANVEEAGTLAGALPGVQCMILGPCLPAERGAAVEAGVIVTISSADEAACYDAIGQARVNLKIDTGMGRIGAWQDEAMEVLHEIRKLKNIILHSISTHLPSAGDDEAFTHGQLRIFADLAREASTLCPAIKAHAVHSAGIFCHPEYAFDLVRPGLMLYGSASPDHHQPLLKQALTWKTRIIFIKDVPAGRGISYGRTYITPCAMRVATLAAGYADGYPRSLSNKGVEVLIHGARCPVLGTISMDQMVVDVSAVPKAGLGSEAVLTGSQDGEFISAGELASKAGTIPWEIFTGLGNRVHRFYKRKRLV